jgi:hypothetical protein
MLKISFAGDIVLADTCFDRGFGFGSKLRKTGNASFLEGIGQPFIESTFSCANLEFVISSNESSGRSKNREFLVGSEVREAVKKCSIDCFSVANNHVLDHGVEAYKDTLVNLKSIGVGYMGDKENKYKVFEYGDFRIGVFPLSLKRDSFDGISRNYYNSLYFPSVLSAAQFETLLFGLSEDLQEVLQRTYHRRADEYVLDASYVRKSLRHEIILYEIIMDAYSEGALETEIFREIAELTQRCDFTVVYLHWGDEYVNTPAPWQRRFGRRLVKEGANLVVGCHSHAIQGIEILEGVPIIYSLGNYYFNSNNPIENEGLVLHVEIDEKTKGDVKYRLSFTVTRYDPKRMNVTFARESSVNETSRMREYSAMIGKLSLEEYIEYAYERLLESRRLKKRFYLTNLLEISPSLALEVAYGFLKRRVSMFVDRG